MVLSGFWPAPASPTSVGLWLARPVVFWVAALAKTSLIAHAKTSSPPDGFSAPVKEQYRREANTVNHFASIDVVKFGYETPSAAWLSLSYLLHKINSSCNRQGPGSSIARRWFDENFNVVVMASCEGICVA